MVTVPCLDEVSEPTHPALSRSPATRAIIAALYPVPIGYLYFVAQPDGKHISPAPYSDHLAAIKRVRQRR